MWSSARWAFVVVLLVAVAGCGGSEEQEPVVQDGPNACDVRASFGFCYEFTGSAWTDMEAENACLSAPEAVFLADGCPQQDRVATCTLVPEEDPGKDQLYVYYEGADLATARDGCAGTFQKVR